jgi:hypothetical protein
MPDSPFIPLQKAAVMAAQPRRHHSRAWELLGSCALPATSRACELMGSCGPLATGRACEPSASCGSPAAALLSPAAALSLGGSGMLGPTAGQQDACDGTIQAASEALSSMAVPPALSLNLRAVDPSAQQGAQQGGQPAGAGGPGEDVDYLISESEIKAIMGQLGEFQLQLALLRDEDDELRAALKAAESQLPAKDNAYAQLKVGRGAAASTRANQSNQAE